MAYFHCVMLMAFLQASELSFPLEDKKIGLGEYHTGCVAQQQQHSQQIRPDPAGDAAASAREKSTEQQPFQSRERGSRDDSRRLFQHLHLQLAAAWGLIPLRAQIAVMQRLLLLLLPLLQGSSPPRTFLRCVFFKKPFPPVLQSSEEGRLWPLIEGARLGGAPALILTGGLPLLRYFCSVYVRLCVRLQALHDFGTQELFLHEEDYELCNDASPWNGLLHAGWQEETNREDLNKETTQEYTDRIEQTCADNSLALWALEDFCVKELLLWNPPERKFSMTEGPCRAPKTRQESILRRMVAEAEGVTGDAKEKGGKAGCGASSPY